MNGKKFSLVYPTRAAISVLCSAVFLFRPPTQTQATTVTNYLNYNYGWPQYSIAVNVGDTVVWVNQWTTNSVESYGGEWKSPFLNSGDSFSFTFTNAGFYAYRTLANTPSPTVGTVTVLAWTGAPPAVTINTPVDGSAVGLSQLVQASVTNMEALAQIEYFSNSVLIGTVTNAPYWLWWGSSQTGQSVLIAKATDRQGRVTSSPPITVITGGGRGGFGVWGPRLLPTGEMLFFYNADNTGVPGYVSSSDSPYFPYNVCFSGNYTNSNLGWVRWPGVFVDEGVRISVAPRRFYAVVPGTETCP